MKSVKHTNLLMMAPVNPRNGQTHTCTHSFIHDSCRSEQCNKLINDKPGNTINFIRKQLVQIRFRAINIEILDDSISLYQNLYCIAFVLELMLNEPCSYIDTIFTIAITNYYQDFIRIRDYIVTAQKQYIFLMCFM